MNMVTQANVTDILGLYVTNISRDSNDTQASMSVMVNLSLMVLNATIHVSENVTSSTLDMSSFNGSLNIQKATFPSTTLKPKTGLSSTSHLFPFHGAATERIETTYTGWISPNHNISLLHGNYNIYVLSVMLGLFFLCFMFLVCWVQCKKRLVLFQYERFPSTQFEPRLDYKQSQGVLLDEEYENTFVGVSLPILLDVTEV